MGAEHTDVDGVEATDRGRHASIRTIGLYEAMPCLRNGHTNEDAALPAVLSPHLPGRHQPRWCCVRVIVLGWSR